MGMKTRAGKPSDRVPVWTLGYLEACARDAKSFLNDDQYAHLVQQFDELACERNPRMSDTLDIRPIEDFFELRDKGGILGKINVRVYFCVVDNRRLILALACWKKEADGQTPQHMKIRVRHRMRLALAELSRQLERDP